MPTMNVGDLEMYYEIHGEENEIPLVLLQGLGLDVLAWGYQIPEFSKKYRVIVFDNRDVGRTTKTNISYTVDTFTEDTYQLLKKLGVEKAHFLGFSMGGLIAQTFALEHPEMVRSISLCATAPSGAGLKGVSWMTCWKELVQTMSKESFLTHIFPWIWAPETLWNEDFTKTVLEQWVNHPYAQPPEAFVRQCKAIEEFHMIERLPGINVPTFIFVGDWDILTPVRYSEFMTSLIPNAELKILPECGHMFLMEKPEEFNKAVLEFLEKH